MKLLHIGIAHAADVHGVFAGKVYDALYDLHRTVDVDAPPSGFVLHFFQGTATGRAVGRENYG
jgi:hypothetical protein